MSRNLVLCCDGTANEFSKHNTNVVKLFATLDHDPYRQVAYYHPGLGTMEAAGSLTTFSRKATKVAGLAFGYGLADDIRDAYVFLMRHFEPGDQVYLFGFSRGAYTARAVAALLHLCGLIRPGNEALVPYAIRMLTGIERARGKADGNGDGIREYFAVARHFKATMSAIECKPWFVGVWDTVSSVGWIENPLQIPYVTNNPDIAIGRHAIAIDERRAFFRTHLWRRPKDETVPWGPRDVKQVWFPGVHSDVGGGYPEPESGLAKVALEWMLDEAELAGLLVDPAKRHQILGRNGGGNCPPDPKATAHESLRGAWRVAELVPKKYFDRRTGRLRRRMNLFRRRRLPRHAMVHDSAYERGVDYVNRLPADAVRVSTPLAAAVSI